MMTFDFGLEIIPRSVNIPEITGTFTRSVGSKGTRPLGEGTSLMTEDLTGDGAV